MFSGLNDSVPPKDTAPAAAVLHIRLFGQMAVVRADGQEVMLRGRKTRALLAILAMASPRPVSRTEITALLWSQRGREQAYASLRQAIHHLAEVLNTVCPGLLTVGRTQLMLETSVIWVDADVIVAASGARPEALALYRSGLLDDLAGLDPAFDRWRTSQLERLTALARGYAEAALHELETGRQRHALTGGVGAIPEEADAVIRAAEQLIYIDPGHEGGWRALIRAHAARGDRAAAISVFERCRHAMAKVAQLVPNEETLELVAALRAPPYASAVGATVASASRQRRPTRFERTGRVCVGVLPLRYLASRMPDELSLGLAEEITTALARVMWISCVGPTSLVTESDRSHTDQAWRDLGVDCLLEVSLQPSGGRVRVTARLLDLHAGRKIVWARRFDRGEKDMFSLQDEISAGIVAQLDPELLMLEGERAEHLARQREKEEAEAGSAPGSGKRDLPESSADELLLRAIPSLYRLEPKAFCSAGDLLATAVAMAPSSASALAWYGYWYMFQVGQGWSVDRERDTAVGGRLAARAVALNSGDARALTISGHVRGFLAGKPDEALSLHERALALNPHLALAWCFSGLALSYLGRHEEAILRADTARRLAPFDPHGFFFEMAACVPHLLLGQYERTVEASTRSIALNASFSSAYKMKLCALGHLGRLEEAARILEQLLALEPALTVENAVIRSPFKVAADLARYGEGLRKGGLPQSAVQP